MLINTIDVTTPIGFSEDVLIVKAEGTTPFAIELYFDATPPVTLSAHSVSNTDGTLYYSHVDVSDVFRHHNCANINSCTITVTLSDGTSDSALWGSIAGDVEDGRTLQHKTHGSVTQVYAPFGEVDVWFGCGISDVVNKGAGLWMQSLSGVVPIEYYFWSRDYDGDDVIHTTMPQLSGVFVKVPIGWYGEAEEVSPGIYEWTRWQCDGVLPDKLYSDTDTPIAGTTVLYENSDLSGVARLVTDITDMMLANPCDDTVFGDISSLNVGTGRDIQVLEAPCYDRMLWLAFIDPDGCKRYFPVRVLDVETGVEGELYTTKGTNAVDCRGSEIRSKERNVARVTEVLTVGMQNATPEMMVEDILLAETIEVNVMKKGEVNPVGKTTGVLVDETFMADYATGDVTFRIALQ